jgi:hypothetical protein
MNFIKKLFRSRSEQDRMYNFLSQATDQIHLEVLQKEWDRMKHTERNMW